MTLLIFHFIIWCLKPHKSIQMTRMEKGYFEEKKRGRLAKHVLGPLPP